LLVMAPPSQELEPPINPERFIHDNSCSHDESLNCFGRFGNRLNESDH